MTGPESLGGARRASPAYLILFGVAALGLPFLAIGLGALLRGRAGGDPMAALNGEGLAAFLGMWALLFAVRLIFSERTPKPVQDLTRTLISVVFGLELLGSGLALILALGGVRSGQAAASGGVPLAGWFIALAVLCQGATATWLLRYRRA